MTRTLASRLAAVAVAFALTLFALSALAAGAFKLKSNEVNETAGAWRLFVKIELPKAPPNAHQPLRFVFTKTMVYERSLVDGKSEPVITRQALQGQNPMVVTQDVDFADATGKIWKGTNFDFMLKRDSGFEAGEYKLQLRTPDGAEIGAATNVTLKGDNPVVDRRSIAFNAKDPSIKKFDDRVDAGAKVAKNDEEPASAAQAEVHASGTAEPFVPKDAFNRTAEEDIKVQKPGGCGCSVPGLGAGDVRFALPGLALGALALARAARSKRAG